MAPPPTAKAPKAKKKAPAAKPANVETFAAKLARLLPEAPPPDLCQHPHWTNRGNERIGKAWCPSCEREVRLRECFDARMRAVLLEVLA